MFPQLRLKLSSSIIFQVLSERHKYFFLREEELHYYYAVNIEFPILINQYLQTNKL